MTQWKKSNAVISLRSERKPGLFKTEYSFVLSYYVEIIREKNENELQTIKSHEKVLQVLNKHINNTITNKLTELSDEKVVCRKHIVQNVFVNQKVYNKYLNSKSIPLLYSSDDRNVIKFS